ncbi:hemopexin-like isoform X2 [Pristis pectinata]|uniref:hemopexin-like isoform X2 n=1 Tax=Pristis pectinata TaxID=685728 RepID=UPI00223D2087|nr:hemopexin-like isoform X2 [Pristis pectinata]
MKFLLGELCLCLVVTLSLSLPRPRTKISSGADSPEPTIPGSPDRCDGLGFDAAVLDEVGTPLYFRDAFVWKGFHGTAKLINSTWPQLPSHLDAAFRMHHSNDPAHHDRTFFFKGNQVWQYHGSTLEGTFLIRDKFPGIPDNLDGAIGCFQGDCVKDSVLFSKGDTMYVLDLSVKTVKERSWQGLRGCSALMQWVDRYYCFKGINFTRFNPSSGEVPAGYPKDARDYFFKCHWSGNTTTDRNIFNICSNVSFDEFDEDELGRMYAFRSNWYFRLDAKQRGWHPWPLSSAWPSLHGKINGVFSWNNNMYFIQGSQLYIYKAEARYTLIEGYPKPVRDELGISSSDVDATFICPGTSELYIIMGNHMQMVNLQHSPRVLGNGIRIGHSKVDGAMCNGQGIFVFVGTQYYRYNSTSELSSWKNTPAPRSIKQDFLHCPHQVPASHHH